MRIKLQVCDAFIIIGIDFLCRIFEYDFYTSVSRNKIFSALQTEMQNTKKIIKLEISTCLSEQNPKKQIIQSQEIAISTALTNYEV